MAEVCSCGTRLVEDALFCHRCGKPTRDIIVPETVAPPEPPPVAPELTHAIRAAAAPPPSFHNPVATKIALAVAGVGTLLTMIDPVHFVAAGFFSVFFYRRRTGHALDLQSGVRMGWMTGMIMFVILAFIVGAAALMLHAMGGAIPPEMKGRVDPEVFKRANELVGNASALALQLLAQFLLATLCSMAGGALGAKMVGRG